MAESQTATRREFLGGSLFGLLSLFVGAASCRERPGQDQPATAFSRNAGVRPSMALSLAVLQEGAKGHLRALPDRLAHLGGMNRIEGFMSEPDGEILLLGGQDPSSAPIHLDDLAVALRNAYKAGPVYQGVPGCSIDPWPGAADPWRIQQVTVFGMPAVAMSARFVDLDFELKKVCAGILSLGDGIPSLHELARSASPLCQGSPDKEKKTELTHRFWFHSSYPPAPRFVEEDRTVLILRPVGVQLLTEQEFLDQTGRRTGSAPPSPLAKSFARRATHLLSTNRIHRYARMRADFRVLEVGQLLRFKRVPAEGLHYLLQDHPLTAVPVPAFVGGIRRQEHGEVVCSSRVTERHVPGGRLIESQERLQRYQLASRGGVEAEIRLASDHFAGDRSGVLARLCRQVRAARPSSHALLWHLY